MRGRLRGLEVDHEAGVAVELLADLIDEMWQGKWVTSGVGAGLAQTGGQRGAADWEDSLSQALDQLTSLIVHRVAEVAQKGQNEEGPPHKIIPSGKRSEGSHPIVGELYSGDDRRVEEVQGWLEDVAAHVGDGLPDEEQAVAGSQAIMVDIHGEESGGPAFDLREDGADPCITHVEVRSLVGIADEEVEEVVAFGGEYRGQGNTGKLGLPEKREGILGCPVVVV